MNTRLKRLSAEITKVISESISKIRDPDCTEMVCVLGTEINAELKDAKVTVSIFSKDEEKRQKTFKAVQKAAPFLRHELSQEIKARTVPALHFVLDNSAEYSQKINTILESLNITHDEDEK